MADGIEPEFAALRYFVLGGTDHRTHTRQDETIDRYMRWRNAHAQPKTTSRPRQSSAAGPVTRPTLHDAALARGACPDDVPVPRLVPRAHQGMVCGEIP